MLYLVCLALLVLVGAWLVSAYSRFNHLYTQVQDSWNQWAGLTRERNLRLGILANIFSATLPEGSALPQEIFRLLEDSGRALNAVAADGGHNGLNALSEAEKRLRAAVEHSVSELERNDLMQGNRQLLKLCSEMSDSMVQQDQFAHFYNHHAGVYNAALAGPSGRLFAAMLGFSPVERI